MIVVTSLGGSGEDGRSCYLVEADGHVFLLDCGVRRMIAPIGEVYPLLNREIVSRLDAVFLSHVHQDHTAALPYLHALGWRGPVYASEPTRELVGSYLQKWIGYAEKGGGSMPFDPVDDCSFDIRPFPAEVDGVPLSVGRSGHCKGSVWMEFSFSSGRLLYTGDTTPLSISLARDPFPRCDVLVCDSGYADMVLDQEAQYEKLASLCKETIRRGGCMLLPVPAEGRGVCFFLKLRSLGLPLLVEQQVYDSYLALKGDSFWRKDDSVWDDSDGSVRVVDILKETPSVGGRVALVAGNMMTTERARRYFDLVKGRADSSVLITGHTALGTLGCNVLDASWRQEHGVLCSASKLVVKVHQDEADVLRTVQSTGARRVMLFHCPQDRCRSLVSSLSVPVVCSVGASLRYE